MTDDDETILHDRPHKDPGRARAAKVVRARKLAKETGEPGLSYDPLEVDEGWEPPYRNKNACLEQVKQAVAPMWHNIDALQKQIDFLENIIEDALTTYYGDDCYYQLKQDYKAYQQELKKLDKQ